MLPQWMITHGTLASNASPRVHILDRKSVRALVKYVCRGTYRIGHLFSTSQLKLVCSTSLSSRATDPVQGLFFSTQVIMWDAGHYSDSRKFKEDDSVATPIASKSAKSTTIPNRVPQNSRTNLCSSLALEASPSPPLDTKMTKAKLT